jgi:hypothetical protein
MIPIGWISFEIETQISNGGKALEIKQKIIRNLQRCMFRINSQILDPAVQDPEKVHPTNQPKDGGMQIDFSRQPQKYVHPNQTV